MTVQFLLDKMAELKDQEAVAVGSNVITYGQLLTKYHDWLEWIKTEKIQQGEVVSIKSDYSADSISLFLALTHNRNIIVPLSNDSKAHFDTFCDIAQNQYDIILGDGPLSLIRTNNQPDHELYKVLHERNQPGLVLFSSGSTGKSKAIFHDLSQLLNKFTVPRKMMRTLAFLQFDHIGGVNTLLYTLANGGTAVVPAKRTPESVCEAIDTHQVEVLPTSPTFINLLLLSGAADDADLSSLKLITYGTETMPDSTLAAITARFPETKLLQTYGLSEVGILRSKSRDSKSLWVKVGGAEFETKIIEGRLWIKSESAMLGYLNAPSPFDEEGFLDTGDQVEQDGEWIKILGRQSEIINVGGEKVYPAEVESVVLEMSGVEDAAVYSLPHAITGMIVAIEIKLDTDETLAEFKVRLRQHCTGRLQAYKIPRKITLIDNYTHNARFKRMRKRS
ncbi:long-chain fatty acid--CoA ligase [Paraglaciecola chathamensis]|uniref:Long-chain fatty acid--CoA ligase n=1 Tax=Paraglaciecola chathamensis TaxID=368405 RepID=A0ABS0WI04_9ALTE|nr:fatty acid--CoA ligase family protein [Paraglaciecola chathamensis]MBJ2138094.1 long-chain fatty acid--CoA ligase [Paraglaciecola chathamensis]